MPSDAIMLRAALLLSGHLRQVCESPAVRQQLLDQAEQCRLHFGDFCDIFIHTWSTIDAGTRKWNTGKRSKMAEQNSSRCIFELVNDLRPTSYAVERQDLNATDINVLRPNVYFRPPLVAMRMNVHGMAAATQLMHSHARSMKFNYSVAVRMRLDLGHGSSKFRQDYMGIGPPRLQLASRGWSAVLARTRLASARTAVSSEPRTIHGCQGFSPGVKNGDNCFWSAPASVLSEVVVQLANRLDAYLPPPAANLAAASKRSLLNVLNVSSCSERLLRLNPEAALLCAMRERGVLGCALNCTTCSHPTAATPCGSRSPFCVEGGSCSEGCCLSRT